MKDFIVKHPIISLLMLEDICIMVQNIAIIVTGSSKEKKRGIIMHAAKGVADLVDKKNDEKELSDRLDSGEKVVIRQ